MGRRLPTDDSRTPSQEAADAVRTTQPAEFNDWEQSKQLAWVKKHWPSWKQTEWCFKKAAQTKAAGSTTRRRLQSDDSRTSKEAADAVPYNIRPAEFNDWDQEKQLAWVIENCPSWIQTQWCIQKAAQKKGCWFHYKTSSTNRRFTNPESRSRRRCPNNT